jgi:hypothetical protein
MVKRAQHRSSKNVIVDRGAFETLMLALIASPPIRKDDLKPKR